MNRRHHRAFPLLILVLSLGMPSCLSGQLLGPSLTSTQGPPTGQSTSKPTLTPTITPPQEQPTVQSTGTPTNTITPPPLATDTAIATLDLSIPQRIPQPRDNITRWGWVNSIQIWTTDIEPYDCDNTGVLDFICDADVDPVTGLPFSKTARSMHYWNENAPMTFEGQIPLENSPKTITLFFRDPVKNVAVTSGPGDMVYIDSIVGITPDGTRIPIGYTVDESGILIPAPLFFDGYAFSNGAYGKAEKIFQPPPVCGMVGLENDNHYSVLGGMDIGKLNGDREPVGSFILFRLPRTPALELTSNDLWAARGVNAYKLAGIEITALYNNHPNYINICR